MGRIIIFIALGLIVIFIIFLVATNIFSRFISLPPPALAPTPTPQNGTPASLFYILTEDGGLRGDLVGCNDSLIEFPTTLQSDENPPLAAVINQLITNPSPSQDGVQLYNSLSGSNLTVASVDIQNSTATVNLSGDLALGGVCDGPRLESQLTQTIIQFDQIDSAEIFINGQPLSDILDQR